MNLRAGSMITWRGTRYEVILITALHAVLRDDTGSEIEASIEELSRSAEVTPVVPLLSGLFMADEGDPGNAEILAWRDALERIEAAGQVRGQKKNAVVNEAERLSAELGRTIGERTVYRQMASYREHGIAALGDGRTQGFGQKRSSRVDPRIVEVLNEVLEGRRRASTTSGQAVIEQVTRLARKQFGDDIRIPAQATFYRLLESEDRGRFSFGSAKTRESLALQPRDAFGRRTPLRPGEQVQIDTTRLDVMVRIDEETIGRPELTILLDVASRSILAAVLRPEGTKSMDLVVVLARALVPYARRQEGARETRQLISTEWAESMLIDQEKYERHRMAQPYIFPETITTDRGRTYVSTHFYNACASLGISLVAAAPHTPTDKPHVERAFESINTLFLQYVRGYVGRSVEHRGKDVDSQSEQLLTIAQMQELLEDWIAVEWQNRSQDGLRDPLHPKIKLSPNEMCRAFRHIAPELHVPLNQEDFIALLPIVHRRINRYGVTIDHRVYDSQRLAEFRRRRSPSKAKQGRWPIRVDPYNLHVVWLEAEGEFIPLRWADVTHEMPMLGDVWRHARAEYRTRDGAVDEERQGLTSAMKEFAGRGNPKRAARQTARAIAVANDPMNMTSVKQVDGEGDTDEGVDVMQDSEGNGAEWPNRGGFPFITDAIDEVRRRVEE